MRYNNPKLEQQLAQNIVGNEEKNFAFNIFGEEREINYFNPRFFWENDCNVVLLKPSTYLVNLEEEILNYMIPDKNNIVTSYDINLGNSTNAVKGKKLVGFRVYNVTMPDNGWNEVFKSYGGT